jgi:predicted PurR-regulated permease PerM
MVDPLVTVTNRDVGWFLFGFAMLMLGCVIAVCVLVWVVDWIDQGLQQIRKGKEAGGKSPEP